MGWKGIEMVTKITYFSVRHFNKETGKNLKVKGPICLKVENRIKE